jgi:hypothetical protein
VSSNCVSDNVPLATFDRGHGRGPRVKTGKITLERTIKTLGWCDRQFGGA